jgi:transposase
MKENDGRKLSHEALQQIRITSVKRVEAGESPEEVIKSIGFERVCIYRWIAAYRAGGIEALKSKKITGRPALLSPTQLRKLYMVTEKSFKVDVFIEFLKRLITGEDKPVYLIVDGHPVHKAKKVKEFVKRLNGKLELFYLPGYSPELNPDEYVWSHVKHHTAGKMQITGPDQLKKLVTSALHKLARIPRIIMGFFKAPDLQFYVS